MSGLGLSQAVDAYMTGVAGQNRLRQLRAQRREMDAMDAADAAYGAVHQRAQQAALAANPAGEYRPSDEVEFEAAEARGQALAKAGMWKQYLENETLVQKQRVRVRGEALQQYRADGDPEALVRKVYPTIFDGRKIVGTKRIEGAAAVEGLKAIPDKVEIEFSDGQKVTKPVSDLVSELNQSMMDPAKFAEAEIKNNFAQQLIEARGAAVQQAETIKAQGKVDTEKAKGQARLDVEGVKLGGKREEIAGRERVATIRAGATLGAASTSAEAKKYAADRGLDGAETRASATRDAATTRATATTTAATTRAGAKGGSGASADKAFDTLHKEITKIIGDPGIGLSSTKTSSEDTLRIARAAEAAISSGVPRSEAMQGAIAAFKRHKAAQPTKP